MTPTHRLHRFFAVPAARPIARVVLLHGYGDHSGKYVHLLSWLADHGVAVSAVDFRGHGRSSGRTAHVSRWEEYLDDLGVMLRALKAEYRGSKIEDRKENLPDDAQSSLLDSQSSVPLFLIGHSHGGLIAIIATLRGMLSNVRGVILSAPYLELKIPVPPTKRIAAELTSRLLPALPFKSGIGGAMLTHDADFIEANKTDPYVPGIATPRWFTTTRKIQAEVRASAASFTSPLLMLIAGQDVIADSRASESFFEQAGSTDKQIRRYPDCRHELLREVGREEIFQNILKWITGRSTTQPLQTEFPL